MTVKALKNKLLKLETLTPEERRELVVYYVNWRFSEPEEGDLVFDMHNSMDKNDRMRDVLFKFHREMSDLTLALCDNKDMRAVEMIGICRQSEAKAYGRKFSKFLRETPYTDIACILLQQLINLKLSDAMRMGYQPAQDYLAEAEHASEFGIRDRKAVNQLLKALRKYERHLAEGRKLGLSIEEIITHDEIFGFLMDRYDDEIVPVAKHIAEFINNEMPKHAKGYDTEVSLYEQPEKVKQEIGKGLKKVADFIRGIRDSEFAWGWLNDDSLAFGYLMAHAERIVAETAERKSND